MRPSDFTTLVHIVGFLTGAALYAMLGVMTLRTRRSLGLGDLGDRIPLATSLLGIIWNLGALLSYAGPGMGLGVPPAWLSACAFAALGLLPAVVVHSTTRPRRPGSGVPTALVPAAYALSLVAAAMQLSAALARHAVPVRGALLLLTAGYGTIFVVLAVSMRRQPGWRRAASAVGLAAFAVMAFHLTQHAESRDPWLVELVGHHASVPLAVAILYQDYRFAFADLFLQRVVALIALVGVAMALYAGVAVPHLLPRLARDPSDPRGTGALVALWVATALCYPLLRRSLDLFVDRVVLRRGDYARLRADLAARFATLETPDAALDATAALLAPALSAGHVTWRMSPAADAGHDGAPLVVARDGGQGATVRVATAEVPSYEIEIDRLSGGRRLLSGEITLLDAVARLAARRIDALRVSQERLARSVREAEILGLAAEAELRALSAQLNPHFLFNALTTIGYLMREAPERALDTLYQLTGLLRAVLRRSDGEFTTLGEELDLVRAYLAIEHARFEERLRVIVDVPAELATQPVPSLILQPLVENAVKHGIAPLRQGGTVAIGARVEPSDPTPVLHLTVADSGAGVAPEQLRRRRSAGIGVTNVERRLARHYGAAASLTMRSAPGAGTTVDIRIPLGVRRGAPAPGAPARTGVVA